MKNRSRERRCRPPGRMAPFLLTVFRCLPVLVLFSVVGWLHPVQALEPDDRAAETPTEFLQDANRVQFRPTDWGLTSEFGASMVNGNALLYRGALFVTAIGEGGQVHATSSIYPAEFRPAGGPAGIFRASHQGDPHSNRAGLGRDPDDDGDGDVNEDDLNGLDDDADGLVDEDFEAIGEEMSVVTFRDDEVWVTGLWPLGIEVRQKVVQWSNDGLETFVGLEYHLKNVGTQHLTDLYLGYDANLDIGPPDAPVYWTDDLVGLSVIDTVVPAPEPGAAPVQLQITVLQGWDAPDNGTTIKGGDAPEWAGFFFLDHPLAPEGPEKVGLTSARTSSSAQGFPGPPRNDDDFYDLVSTPLPPPYRRTRPDDWRAWLGTGPFPKLEPGAEITIVLGFVAGYGESDLRERVVKAQMAWRGRHVDADRNMLTGENGCEEMVRWTGGYPLAPPLSNVGSEPPWPPNFVPPAESAAVRVQWTDEPETLTYPIDGVTFEGYQVWRADVRGGTTPEPEDWMLLGTWRLNPPDSLGSDSPMHLDRVRSGAHGYEWRHTEGVVNGHLYHYAVTTLGHTWKWSAVAERFEGADVPGVPSSAHPLFIQPAWPEGEGCDDVRVVPNPYRGSAEWDTGPGDCDPSGTRLAFARLPRGWTRLDVYSLTGDRVFSGSPDESGAVGECETVGGDGPGGTFFWDLRNERGDEVVSGMYLYVVEAPGETCRGHFVIIR